MKTKKNKILVLGSGTSTGIPMLGCSCKTCLSKNSKDKRYRTSLLIETAGKKNILIDTTPDIRSQLLANKISKVDTAIITHEHADHLHGIDDLRPFCFFPSQHSIPIHSSTICGKIMKERYPYIFEWQKFYNEKKPIIGGGIPRLELELISIKKNRITEKVIEGELFHFFLLPHGYGHALGFVQGRLAYIVDCHIIPDHVIEFLQKRPIDLLIIDCVQDKEHKSHLGMDKCFSYIKSIAPKSAGLIHIGHKLGHANLSKLCKKEFDFPVEPLYDGQKLTYQNAP